MEQNPSILSCSESLQRKSICEESKETEAESRNPSQKKHTMGFARMLSGIQIPVPIHFMISSTNYKK